MKNKWPLIVVVLIACISMASYHLQFNPRVKSYLSGENPMCVERGVIDTIISFSRNKIYNKPLEKIKLVQEIRNCPNNKFGPKDHVLLNSYELKIILYNNLNSRVPASREALEQAAILNAPHIGDWDFYWQLEDMLQMAKGPKNINGLCESISKIDSEIPTSMYNLSRLMTLAVLRCHLIESRIEEGLSLSEVLESQVILEKGRPKSRFESRLMFFLSMTRSYLLLANGKTVEAKNSARRTWEIARAHLRWSLIFPSAQIHHALFFLISDPSKVDSMIREIDKNSSWLEGKPLELIEFWKTFVVAARDVLKGKKTGLGDQLTLLKKQAENQWSGNQLERVFLTIDTLETMANGESTNSVLMEYRSQWGTNYLYLLLKEFSKKS